MVLFASVIYTPGLCGYSGLKLCVSGEQNGMAKTYLYLVNNSEALRPESTRILFRQMKLIYRQQAGYGHMTLIPECY